jgi:hypothetical protein
MNPNLGNDRHIQQNPIDRIFVEKKGEELKKGLLDVYGTDHDVTYLLTKVKHTKEGRLRSEVSVEKVGEHLTWKVDGNDIALGSSWVDHLKIGFKGIKHKVKLFLNFFDYEKRSADKLDEKINLINEAYEKCLGSEKKPARANSSPQIIPLKAPSEAQLLSDLKEASSANSQLLDNLFAEDSKVDNPEDWALILPDVRKYLDKNPKYQEIWEALIVRKFDPTVELVCIKFPNLPDKKLAKSVLMTQSQTLKDMYSDFSSSDDLQLEFPDQVSDPAKRRFFICLQEGLKGKTLDYPGNKKVALDLYKLASFYDVKWLQNDLQEHLAGNLDASKIYDAMDFGDFVSISADSLEKLEDSPHKRLYLSCIEKMAADALSSETDEQFNDFVNFIKKKDDNHLIAALQRAAGIQLESLRFDKDLHNKPLSLIFRTICRFNAVTALMDYNSLRYNGKTDKGVLILKVAQWKNQSYGAIEECLKFAHLEKDKEIYSLMLSIVKKDLAQKSIYDWDSLGVLESIQNYGKENQLLDLIIASSPEICYLFKPPTMRFDLGGSLRYQVELFRSLLELHPSAKPVLPILLDIGCYGASPNKDQIEEVQSLIRSGVFSGVDLSLISDKYVKTLFAEFKKANLQMEHINISPWKLTIDGYKSIFNWLKISSVRDFTLESFDQLDSISLETARLIAEVIQSHQSLEEFSLKCRPFESRDAFDLVFKAVKENKKLNNIELPNFLGGSDEEIEKLSEEREGLYIHNR